MARFSFLADFSSIVNRVWGIALKDVAVAYCFKFVLYLDVLNFRQWPSRRQQITNICLLFLLFECTLHHSKKKVTKKTQNSRNQGFSFCFCLTKEGSGIRAGSGSVPLTNRSGSGRPKTYGSYGSGSATLISTFWLLCNFLSLKNDVRIWGPGAVSKCHGCGTLVLTLFDNMSRIAHFGCATYIM